MSVAILAQADLFRVRVTCGGLQKRPSLAVEQWVTGGQRKRPSLAVELGLLAAWWLLSASQTALVVVHLFVCGQWLLVVHTAWPACPVPLPPVAPDSDYATIVAGVLSGVIGGFLLGAAFLHCALPPAAPSRSRTTSPARFPGVRESVSDLVLVSGGDL